MVRFLPDHDCVVGYEGSALWSMNIFIINETKGRVIFFDICAFSIYVDTLTDSDEEGNTDDYSISTSKSSPHITNGFKKDVKLPIMTKSVTWASGDTLVHEKVFTPPKYELELLQSLPYPPHMQKKKRLKPFTTSSRPL